MTKKSLSLALAGLAAACIGAAPAAAQTNGFILQCLSARTAGQGCVTRAQSGVPSSLFRDPAGIAFAERSLLEVNASAFAPSLTFRNGANPSQVDGTGHTYPLGSIGFVGPALPGGLRWAVGVEPIGGFGADFELMHDLLSGPGGGPIDYESFFAAAKFGPAVAMQIVPGLSVGAAASVVYAQIRDFRMPFTMPPDVPKGLAPMAQLDPALYGPMFAQFSELTAYGDSRDYDGFGWSADVGLSFRSRDGIVLSASWSPRSTITVDGGTAVIDMSAQFGQMMEAMVMARVQAYGEAPGAAQNAVMQQLAAAGLDLSAGLTANYDAATEITLPMSAGLGVSLPVTPALRVSAETEWRQWSRAEETMPFRLTNGTNPNINLMMNLDPTDGSFTYPFPLEWRDAWSVKGGFEYALGTTTAVRAGYIFGENPVPDHTVFITFPAIATHALTLGSSFALGSLPLDVALVHAFNTELDGCGDGHKLGAEYLGSTSGLRETVVTVGLRWPF